MRWARSKHSAGLRFGGFARTGNEGVPIHAAAPLNGGPCRSSLWTLVLRPSSLGAGVAPDGAVGLKLGRARGRSAFSTIATEPAPSGHDALIWARTDCRRRRSSAADGKRLSPGFSPRQGWCRCAQMPSSRVPGGRSRIAASSSCLPQTKTPSRSFGPCPSSQPASIASLGRPLLTRAAPRGTDAHPS